MSGGEQTPEIEPGWYPDPAGRHEHRWWDGMGWTENVSSHGRQAVDSLGPAKEVSIPVAPEKIQRQIDKATPRTVAGPPQDTVRDDAGSTPPPPTAPPPPAAGSDSAAPISITADSVNNQSASDLLDQRVLVINQKTKLIEVNTEFALFDAAGHQIGAVRQVGQSKLKKIFRFIGDLDQYFTHKYQVVDATGNVRLGLTRPAKFVKSRVIVTNDLGDEIGEIVQQNWFGKIRFNYVVNGEPLGGIFAENWRAWNFSIKDAHDREIARITKTFEGVLKTAFTTADNYVLHVHEDLPDPLRQMVFASAVTVDTALKQDARGFNATSFLDFG